MTVEQGFEAGVERFRRSPLAHRTADLAAQTGGVTLSELPFLSMVSLRVAPNSAPASRVESALGARLPEAGHVSSVLVGSVLWLGPDEFLVIGQAGVGQAGVGQAGVGQAGVGQAGVTAGLIAVLVEAIGEDPGSVVDVSANRDTLVLSGPNARDVLEKGCTLDLHPRSFTAGRCAQTTLARGHVLIWQTRAEGTPSGPVYRVLFRGSFADYFADWFTDAAAEFATPGTVRAT